MDDGGHGGETGGWSDLDSSGHDSSTGSTSFGDAGRLISGYESLVRIGSGGSSTVYRALDVRHQRPVAIKVLDLEASSGPRRTAFQREIEAIGRIGSHPNIVTILGSGFAADDHPYLVLPLFERGTYGQLIDEKGPLTWAQAVDVGIKLCSAVETVHRANVVHRDIKPGNVFLGVTPEHPLLADFGISSTVDGAPTRTDTMAVTFGYTAPEVLDDQRPSPASDIYSLAMTIYRLIQGLHAYHAGTPAAVMRKILAEPDRPQLSAGVPPAVAAVVAQGLARDPESRPSSALAMARSLQTVQVEHGLAPTPVVVADEPALASGTASFAGPSSALDIEARAVEASMIGAVRRQYASGETADVRDTAPPRGTATPRDITVVGGSMPAVESRPESADIGGILAAAIESTTPNQPDHADRVLVPNSAGPDAVERSPSLDLPTVVTPRKPRRELQNSESGLTASADRRGVRKIVLALGVLLALLIVAGLAFFYFS